MFNNKFISGVSMLALVGFFAVSSSPLWADEDECETHPTTTSICHLPDEARLEILSYFSPKELATVTQVSSKWHGLAEDESLWKKYIPDVLDLKVPEGTSFKSIVKGALGTETIDVILNTLTDSDLIEEFAKLGYKKKDTVKKPIIKRSRITSMFPTAKRGAFRNVDDRRMALQQRKNTPEARDKRFNNLIKGTLIQHQNIKKAHKLNDRWIEQGDTHARTRKFNGLFFGLDEYKKDEVEAVRLNNLWADKGDQNAIARKIEGRAFGFNGYEKMDGFLGIYIDFLKSVKSDPKS